jgi:hypothetical protein
VGLIGDAINARRMKDPVRGQAQVVSCSQWNGGTSANCRMQLVVQAPGVPATAVELDCMVHADRWPSPGITLPVTVDRDDPQKLKVEWDEVERSQDSSARAAEELAAAMRGQGGAAGAPFAGVADGGVNVVNLRGGGLSEDQAQKLRTLGIDPTAITQAVQQAGAIAGAMAPAPDQAAAGGAEDQRLARLEKLGELRAQGILTQEEFEAQKRRILES